MEINKKEMQGTLNEAGGVLRFVAARVLHADDFPHEEDQRLIDKAKALIAKAELLLNPQSNNDTPPQLNNGRSEQLPEHAIAFAKWMKKSGVYISLDDEGDYCYDISTTSYTAEELYGKFKKERGNCH